ncbi:hypothetical protein MSAS_20380 [Mycobacterium saskatchewanense]|nr:hypothetical protein MSAS_20380 [Mycobacterium saskatchewanense]
MELAAYAADDPTHPQSGTFGWMIVTGALLAEAASVVDNKLNVTGGVVSRFVIGPDRVARLCSSY